MWPQSPFSSGRHTFRSWRIPSHAGGLRHLVAPLAYAAVAAGADGLLVEVHPEPELAVSDGDQSLTLPAFDALMEGLRPFVEAAGRTLAPVEVEA